MNIENIYDPLQTHRDMVKHISGEGKVDVVDPTNSFMLMLEAIGEATSNAATEAATLVRAIYPTTCVEMSELLRHATGEELFGLYASPAAARFVLYVNAIDVFSNGLPSDLSEDTKMVQISSGTKITVQGITYTTVNNVRIHYDGTTSIVEQLTNDDYGFNRYGSIRSGIHTDVEGGKWIKFELNARQFDYQVHTMEVVGPLDVEISHPDSFWYVTAKGIFNDGIKDLLITHSDIVYDINQCTLKVLPLGDKIKVHLPNIYLINDNAPLSIELTIHVTKGKFNANLGEFNYKEFMLTRSPEDLALNNVTIIINSDKIVTGGKDTKTIEEVKDSIINNVTGPLITPITIDQLQERARRDGYSLTLYKDMATHRMFIIAKNIDPYVFKDIQSDPDTYINEAVLTSNLISPNIITIQESTVIKQNTMFKNIVDGCVPVDDILLLDTFEGKGGYEKNRLLEIMNKDRYFFTPFANVIYPDKICRTFDFASPELTNLEIINRNVYTPYRINISEYQIEFVNDQFEITFKLIGLDTIGLSEYPIMTQLSIDDVDGIPMYFDMLSLPTLKDPTVKFTIPTNSYITKDNRLMIKEGGIWHFMDIEANIRIMIFTPKDIGNATEIYVDEKYIKRSESATGLTGITNENITCRFVVPKDNLFNETAFTYTGRKYQVYEEDVPFFYDENVYAFEVNGCPTDSTTGPDMTIIHVKGSPKVDKDGNTIYRYRKGDVKLVDGKPIVDGVRGIEIRSNLLMLEAEYKTLNDRLHDDAFMVSKAYIDEFINFAKSLDVTSLESTSYRYRPIKDSGLVKCKVYDKIVYLHQQVRPEIELYIDSNSSFKLDTASIGRIIQIEIEKEVVSLDAIRKALAKKLSIVGASVVSLGLNVKTEYITILRNQFALKKLMTPNNEVVYDIDVKIVKV